MMFEFSMYYLSFLPLWISILFIDFVSLCRGTAHGWTERIGIRTILLVGVLCGVYTFIWLRQKGEQNREQYVIQEAKEERFAAVEFLMSYVFPLFAFDFTQWDGALLFLLFFGCFGFLVHRHRIFCTNMVLELCRYRVYECSLKQENHTSGKSAGSIITKRIVSRNGLEGLTGRSIRTRKINNDYQFEIEVIQDIKN